VGGLDAEQWISPKRCLQRQESCHRKTVNFERYMGFSILLLDVEALMEMVLDPKDTDDILSTSMEMVLDPKDTDDILSTDCCSSTLSLMEMVLYPRDTHDILSTNCCF
jgi:hypothetical protein